MTKETKQLFGAPWEADVCCEIHDKNERLICICCPGEPHIADRLARLPELYDALLQATEDACRTCNHEKAEGILDRPCNDLHANECYVAEWRKLLKKVRDGK